MIKLVIIYRYNSVFIEFVKYKPISTLQRIEIFLSNMANKAGTKNSECGKKLAKRMGRSCEQNIR